MPFWRRTNGRLCRGWTQPACRVKRSSNKRSRCRQSPAFPSSITPIASHTCRGHWQPFKHAMGVRTGTWVFGAFSSASHVETMDGENRIALLIVPPHLFGFQLQILGRYQAANIVKLLGYASDKADNTANLNLRTATTCPALGGVLAGGCKSACCFVSFCRNHPRNGLQSTELGR